MVSNTHKNYHDLKCVCNNSPCLSQMVNSDENELRYQDIVKSLESIDLLIVGNEPYPTGSNGIAFCKSSWKEFLDGRCGGRYLLCSLGIDLCKSQSKYTNPIDLFTKMAAEKIVFVNQSDLFLQECLKKSIKTARTCGSNISDAVKKNIKEKVQNYSHIERHPSPQGEVNPPDKSGDWFKYWGTHESLLKILEPSGSGPIHNAVSGINA